MPFSVAWKKPGLFGEYDTSRFFVSWWYGCRTIVGQ